MLLCRLADVVNLQSELDGSTFLQLLYRARCVTRGLVKQLTSDGRFDKLKAVIKSHADLTLVNHAHQSILHTILDPVTYTIKVKRRRRRWWAPPAAANANKEEEEPTVNLQANSCTRARMQGAQRFHSWRLCLLVRRRTTAASPFQNISSTSAAVATCPSAIPMKMVSRQPKGALQASTRTVLKVGLTGSDLFLASALRLCKV